MLSDSTVVAYVPVSNLKRSKAFYEDVLGQKPVRNHDYGTVYECAAGSQFFIYTTTFAGTSKATCINWTVADIEQEVAELTAKGVEFERYDLPNLEYSNGIHAGYGVKNAWFKDPDGNILSILQA